MNVMTALSGTVLPASALTIAPGPARFTTAEFWRMAAADAFGDIKLELVEGELHRMPPPGNTHGRLQATLVTALASLFPEPLVRAEIGVDLGNDTLVGCDAAVLKAAIEGDGWPLADEFALVVEIAVSTRDRDLDLKRRLYAAAGIPHYWVVDAGRAVVHVFDRPEGGDYLGLALARFGEPLAVPGTDATIAVA